nr:hypothetical protein [uncultured Duganella sp.]
MPSKLLTLTAACATLAIAGYFLSDSADTTAVAPPLPHGAAPAAAATAATQQTRSPFSGAAPTETTIAQQRYDAREKRMAQGGYGTPAEYFYLPLAQLKQLAATGNIYALIQLGQQYWDEPDAIAAQAGFDASVPPNKLAVAYFSRAVMAGATQPALTLATRLSASEPSESYAWALFAEKLQVKGASELASQLRARLSDREIDAARISAEQKLDQMTQATTDARATTAPAP